MTREDIQKDVLIKLVGVLQDADLTIGEQVGILVILQTSLVLASKDSPE